MDFTYTETGATYNTKDRTSLTRCWDDSKEGIYVIMWKPSTANAQTDDRTIKRLCKILKNNDFGSVFVFNMHIDVCDDIAGIPNGSKVLVSWGNKLKPKESKKKIKKLRKKFNLYCLGVNVNNTPKLPTYLSNNTVVSKYP